MKNTVKIALLGIGISAFLPTATFAHIKWFVEEADPANFPTLSWTDPIVLFWLILIPLAVVIGAIIEKKGHTPRTILTWAKLHRTRIEWTAQILIGLGLIVNAFTGVVFAPTFESETGLLFIAQIAQGVAGALLMLNLLTQVAGLALLIAYILFVYTIGIPAGVEHLLILGLGFFFIVTGGPKGTLTRQWREFGLPVLRISTGISLITLGLQEKLLHPELAHAFLETHPWNFMSSMGMEWFTDSLFVASAGFTELLFGTLLIFGVVTRLNTAVMSFFFVTTAFVLGIGELTGHLPIFGIALLLIFFGAGQKLRLIPNTEHLKNN